MPGTSIGQKIGPPTQVVWNGQLTITQTQGRYSLKISYESGQDLQLAERTRKQLETAAP